MKSNLQEKLLSVINHLPIHHISEVHLKALSIFISDYNHNVQNLFEQRVYIILLRLLKHPSNIIIKNSLNYLKIIILKSSSLYISN